MSCGIIIAKSPDFFLIHPKYWSETGTFWVVKRLDTDLIVPWLTGAFFCTLGLVVVFFLGKIVGIALVGLTQFLLWTLLTGIIYAIIMSAFSVDPSTIAKIS